MRLISLLLLVAVLPTVELSEQAVHVIDHLFEAESPDHSAHHDAKPGDEHGCTGLVHLCAGHSAQVTSATITITTATTETVDAITVAVPPKLTDLNSLEPAQRPPIG